MVTRYRDESTGLVLTVSKEPHATPGIDIVIILGLEPRWSEIKWTS